MSAELVCTQKQRPAGITRIVLHGRLRKKFGPEFNFSASTAARAIQILCILVPRFRDEFARGQYRVIRGKLKTGIALDERMLHLRLAGEMHIVPAARGGKNAGPSKIIMGVALVAAAFILPVVAPAYFGAIGAAGAAATGGSVAVASSLGGVSFLGGLALFGGAMILGGIASVISNSMQTPKPLGSSFLLSGSLNVATQGGPVPVVYGRMRVGSVVVSIGYEAAAYVGEGAVPGSQSVSGDTGYSGDLGYQGTGRGGGGKSGSGAGGGGLEAPNTLRSNATVRIIDLLSEGPIGGLVEGAKSIYFNDTPLLSPDGLHWNFHGVSWTLMHGYPDQDPVSGFPASEQIVPVGVEIFHNTPLVRTVTSATANAVRVTVEIPALYDTNVSNGDINQTDMQFTISMRPSKAGVGGFVGTYTDMVVEGLLSQKCTSPFEKSYRLPLLGLSLGANTWDIQISKLTVDSVVATKQNSLIFNNYTVITDHQLIYPDSAYIALTFDAKAFGAALPTRSYVIDGRILQIPANYNPVTRAYASSGTGTTGGTWDSYTFANAVTSNPAWVLYDMINHDRYGCDIGSTFLETSRADLYVIAQYSDGLVPDGFGGSEPRYSVNAVISEQTDAYVLLQTMTSAFRGMTYWGAGQVMVSNDMPKNPVKLVNQTNVIGGNFDYQGTSLKTRHNVVRATWRDPGNRYINTPEGVELTEDIARRGEVATDIVAWGCTSRGLAHRMAKWLLYTENNQTDVLQYDAGLYHLDLRPGEIFQQHDPSYFGLRWGGRLRSGSTDTTLLLDGLIEPSVTPASTYLITVVMPDNTVGSQTLAPGQIATSPDGTYSVVTLTPLPMQPLPHAEWIILDNNTTPRLFQTIGMAASDPGQFSVSAAEYNPAKFAWVENNIAFVPQVFSVLPALLLAALAPPSHVTAIDYLVGNGNTTIIRLTVSFKPASDLRVQDYEIQVTSPTFQQNYRTAGQSTYDIDNLVPAGYSIAVRSLGRQGLVSAWVSTTDIVVDGLSDPPVAPLGVTAIGGTRLVQVSWLALDRRDLKHYEVQRAPSVSGAPGSFALLAYVAGTAFTDSNSPVMMPLTKWWYKVRAVTTTGVVGDFSVAVAGTTTQFIVDDLADGILNTAKFAAGLSVPSLIDSVPSGAPAPGEALMRFNTANGQLYTWNGSVWTSIRDQVASGTVAIPAVNIIGQLSDAQIAELAATKISGTLTAAQIASIDAAQITGALTSAQIAALAATKISGQLSDSQIAALAATKITGQLTSAQIAALAATKISGQLTDAQIASIDAAKLTGSVTVATVPAVQVSGQLTSAQIAALDAAKLTGTIVYASLPAGQITGQLTDTQIAALSAAKLTGNIAATKISGQLTDSQLAALAANKILGQLSSAQIASLDAAKLTGSITGVALPAGQITGQLTDAQIAAIDAAKLTGNIPATQISGQLTSAQIASIDAAKIGGKLTAAQIATLAATQITGQITDTQLAALAASKILGQLSSDQIAALDGAKLTGSISAATLPAGQVSGQLTNIQIAALDAAKLTGNLSIATVPATAVTGKLTPGQIASVDAAQLTGAITSTQIAANAITTAAIAAGAITTAKLTAGSITANELAANAVTAGKIAADSITANELAANSVTANELAANSVTTAKLTAGVITANELSSGAVTTDKLVAGAVTATTIASGAVTTEKLNANSVTANELAANSVTAGKVAAGAITATELSAGAVTTAKLAAGAVTASSIAADTITSAQIAAGAITASELSANSVTTAAIKAGAVTATTLAAGAVTAESLAVNSVTAAAIAAGAVTANTLAAGAVTAASLAVGSVTAAAIAADSITSSHIATGAITATDLAANSVTTAAIKAGAVTANSLAVNSVTAAAIAADTITSAQIATGAITASELAANAVTAGKIQAGSVTAAELSAGAVTTAKLAAGAVTASSIAADTITSAQIAAGAITASELSANSVTTAAITAGAVTATTLAAGAVTASSLAADSVTTIAISAGAVTANSLAVNSVTASAIAASSITSAKIVTGAVTANELAANAVTAGKIAAASISAKELSAGSVTAAQLAVDAVTASSIAAGAITAAKIATDTITSTQIAANAITASELAANAVTAGKVQAGSISATELAAASVVAGKLAAGAVTAGTIAANAVTATAISAGAVTANELAANSVTAGKIAADAVTAATIKAGEVIAGKLAVDAVVAGNIAANAVTAATIKAGEVVAGKLAVGAVTAGTIATDAVTAATIKAGEVVAGKLGVGAVIAGTIAANAVTATTIKAGEVTAGKLAAGAVLTSNLTVGSATNLCWNSCLETSLDGWNFGASVPLAGYGPWPDPASWELGGYGSGFMQASTNLATNGSQILQAAWDPNAFDVPSRLGIPCLEGQIIEVQAQLMTHRCAAEVIVQFFTGNSVLVGTGVGNRVTKNPVNNQTLSSYGLSWVSATAPAGTVRARASVLAFNDGGADIASQTSPPYVFWTQFGVGEGIANPVAPQPWQNGGVSSIAGGMIRANSIKAGTLAVNSVTAGTIATDAVTAGTIKAGEVIAGKLGTNAVIAGTVAAGAIGADQIAANQIKATHLAADFVLASSAQIGTATIRSANIEDLTVGTEKIAGGAVTGTALTGWNGNIGVPIYIDVPLNSDGKILLWIQSSVYFYSDFRAPYNGLVYCDDVLIHQTGPFGMPGLFMMVHFPGPGIHHYQYNISPGNGTVQGGGMTILSCRK